MSLAVIYSRAQLGVDAPLVTVEAHLANGLPALSIVGLPETAVRESKDRVRSALLYSGFEFPAKRITINLAPADLPKQGGRYDLAIALGILAASGQVPGEPLAAYEFVAELALSGAIRPVKGILPSVLAAAADGRRLICAHANGDEAGLVSPHNSLTAGHLVEVCRQLHDEQTLPGAEPPEPAGHSLPLADLRDVRGQQQARRALEVAAAGSHHLLLIGPPGTGKTLLASRLPGILPELSDREALETAAVTAIGPQGFGARQWKRKPFRTPHHSASAAALVGGGNPPRPGEISLAHQGVLFLDELPEFKRHVLEALREPLETGRVSISRAAQQMEFPARFQLVAAMNPCPCGWLGDPSGRCRCTSEQVQRYRARVSGPLLDRIDLHIEVQRLAYDAMNGPQGEPSDSVRKRVARARQIQLQRSNMLNSQLTPQQIDAVCALKKTDRLLLQRTMEKLQLSARAYHRILRLARTIADMEAAADIMTRHLSEAINYRKLDRTVTGIADN